MLQKKFEGTTTLLQASELTQRAIERMFARQAVKYDDCIAKAKDQGHDDETAARICKSISEDVEEDINDLGKDEEEEGEGNKSSSSKNADLQMQNAPTYDFKLKDYNFGDNAIDWENDESADYNEKAQTNKIDLSYYNDDINACVDEQVNNGLSQEDARRFCQSLGQMNGDNDTFDDENDLLPVKYENREYIEGSDTGSHVAALELDEDSKDTDDENSPLDKKVSRVKIVTPETAAEIDRDPSTYRKVGAAKQAHPKMIAQCVKMKMKHDDSLSEEDATNECERQFKGAYMPRSEDNDYGDYDNNNNNDNDDDDDENEYAQPEDMGIRPSEDQDIDPDFNEPHEYDLGNDGPSYDHFGNLVYNEANTSDVGSFDLEHTSSLDDNDHIETHSDPDHLQMAEDNLEDVPAEDDNESMEGLAMEVEQPGNITMRQGPAYRTSQGITIEKPESPQGPMGAAATTAAGIGNAQATVTVFRNAAQIPVQEDGKVQPFSQNDKLFVKAFILDASVNKNAWGVSPATLDHNIRTYIGKPLVVQADFQHPISPDDDLQHQLEYQELFRIGNIVDVVKKGNQYHAIAEITDNYAKQAFKQGDLPLYVSPQLFKVDVNEPDDNMTRWVGTHLAVVKEPAYGTKVATINGECVGETDKCMTHLKRASIIKKNGYGNCGYCVKALLLSTLQNQ